MCVPGLSGRVLVVDDSKAIRQLIRVSLELEGFEVVTAADGVECLDIVHDVRPDAVTLDVVMPRLDGLRTAARLRADHRTRALPLALISACPLLEIAGEEEPDVDAFLAKPFEPVDLVALVTRLVAGVPRPRSSRAPRATSAGAPAGDESRAGDEPDPAGASTGRSVPRFSSGPSAPRTPGVVRHAHVSRPPGGPASTHRRSRPTMP